MKFGAMIGEVFRALFQKPATRQYPFERMDAPGRLRGKLHWHPENCTGCLLCVKDCPSQALEIFTIDKADKRFVMRYHLDQCTFCSQCVVSCRQDALEMVSDEWELAATNKAAFRLWYGDETDVKQLVESAEANTVAAEDK